MRLAAEVKIRDDAARQEKKQIDAEKERKDNWVDPQG